MEILIKGGPVMYMILLCSIITVCIFVYKFIHLHKSQLDVQDFMAGLRNELISKRVTEAVSICEGAPGPAAKVLKAGIMHNEEGRIGIETAMERVSAREMARLERWITGLATIAVVSPLFGLLGTVLGLIRTFQVMSVNEGFITKPEFAAGMWQALLTTAFGLAVAIPAYIAYNYLVSRINRFARDMEEGAAELIGILCAE